MAESCGEHAATIAQASEEIAARLFEVRLVLGCCQPANSASSPAPTAAVIEPRPGYQLGLGLDLGVQTELAPEQSCKTPRGACTTTGRGPSPSSEPRATQDPDPGPAVGSDRQQELAVLLVGLGVEAIAQGESAQLPRLLQQALEQFSQTDRVALESLAQDLGAVLKSRLGPYQWGAAHGDVLGEAFSAQLGRKHRKSLGQFFTPRYLVEALLDRALAGFDPERGTPFRVVDLSCGIGDFLVAAFDRLIKVYQARARNGGPAVWGRNGHAPEALANLVFREHLLGIDLDPLAVAMTNLRLRLKASGWRGGAHEPPLDGSGDATSPVAHVGNSLNRGLAALNGSFQAVVGNPPYGTRLDRESSAGFTLAKGRFDSTALFIERGLELLADGGRLALVVPHGFSRTGAYRGCREHLLEVARLELLIDAGKAFEGVDLETMAFVAAKRPTTLRPHVEDAGEPRARGPATAMANGEEDLVELWSGRTGSLTHLGEQRSEFYRHRPTIPIYAPSTMGTLVSRFEALGTPLEDLARIRRGSPISANDPALSAQGPGIRVVRGRDIARYVDLAAKPLNWLAVDQRDRASALAPVDRVVYQNIASRIVATLMPKGLLPLDTVNYLEPGSQVTALFLLAYLNSQLAEAYFRCVITNMALLTVHLDRPTIGSLPVAGVADQEAIADGAKKLLAARSSEQPAALLASLANDIDTRIFAAAGLSDAEVAIVREFAPSTSWGGRRSNDVELR